MKIAFLKLVSLLPDWHIPSIVVSAITKIYTEMVAWNGFLPVKHLFYCFAIFLMYKAIIKTAQLIAGALPGNIQV